MCVCLRVDVCCLCALCMCVMLCFNRHKCVRRNAEDDLRRKQGHLCGAATRCHESTPAHTAAHAHPTCAVSCWCCVVLVCCVCVVLCWYCVVLVHPTCTVLCWCKAERRAPSHRIGGQGGGSHPCRRCVHRECWTRTGAPRGSGSTGFSCWSSQTLCR